MMEAYEIGGIIEDASIDEKGHRVINRLHFTEVSLVQQALSEGGIEWWCQSCKNHFFISWEELDRLRAEGTEKRVLCRCKRWLGNISAHSRISSMPIL